MKRAQDILRMVFISPEIVCVLAPFLFYVYSPSLADILIKPMKDHIGFGLAAIVPPLGMLAFNYKECFEMIKPVGRRKALIDWPDYDKLKDRIITSFIWCVIGAIAVFVAVFMVASDFMPRLAITILIAGILSAAAATATVGLAHFTIREIIGE